MSQRDALQSLDADIHAALRGVGFASDGWYRAPGVPSSADPVRFDAYLNEGVDVYGEFGQVTGRRDEIVLFNGSESIAQRGTVVVDGVTYTLIERIAQDASMTQWTVRRA